MLASVQANIARPSWPGVLQQYLLDSMFASPADPRWVGYLSGHSPLNTSTAGPVMYTWLSFSFHSIDRSPPRK